MLFWPDMEVRPKATTEGATLAREPSVLIVDRSEETREVLKTALQRRGLKVLATAGRTRGLELARHARPTLIVLDLDSEDSSPEQVHAQFTQQSQSSQTKMLFLGSLRRGSTGFGEAEWISKPYHFAPLVRKIEELLNATGQRLARSA